MIESKEEEKKTEDPKDKRSARRVGCVVQCIIVIGRNDQTLSIDSSSFAAAK